MSLHSNTREQLQTTDKFTPELKKAVLNLIELVDKYSPLNDFSHILVRDSSIENYITKPKHIDSWMPIRNVLRLVAKVTTLTEPLVKISKISIDGMKCGCDYFKGYITILYEDESVVAGAYTWQWTAFQGYERHFDKFKEFPTKVSSNLKLVQKQVE